LAEHPNWDNSNDFNGAHSTESVIAGHSRSKTGVAEFTLGLAKGKTQGLAYVPAIHVLLAAKTWMPGTGPGMTRKRRARRSGD
jgi:hypothetical protein